MKSFKEYKNELYEQKFVIKKSSPKVNTVVATFGRFNPPTLGHGKLFDKLKELSGTNKADYFIFASQTHDLNKKGKDDKNPLDYDTKMKYLKKMFPEHSRKFVYNNDRSKNNEFSALSMLHDAGYENVIWVVGGDRYDEMEQKPETNRLREFNGKEGQKHGYYNFKNIRIENAGKRDPKSSGVEGMSSSKLKTAAREGDFDSFSKGLPPAFKDVTGLYNAVRKNLANIKEDAPRVDDVREAYVSGELYNVGDTVMAKSNSYVIVERHSNYVSVKSASGEIKKFFLHQIELGEESKVLEYGTTRAANIYKRDTPGQLSFSDAKRFVESEKYYTGLSKSTAQKRKAHFEKQTKMRDDDPNAYKPAPGDARAKTKTSKWTKKYHDRFGDDLDEDVDTALEKKSKKSGISVEILRKVFDRGMAAWKTGHRRGATQHQWGYARVNSFIVGGPTRTSTDADLWDDHKKSLNEETWEDGYERRVVKVTDPEKKAEGFLWRIKGKEKDNLTIKYYKTKPSFEEFSAQMRRVAGHEFGK